MRLRILTKPNTATKRIVLNNTPTIVIGITAISIIYILKFTSWRPFGYRENHDAINETLETLSFSVLAAIVFYIFNEILPSIKRCKIAEKLINNKMGIIKEYFRQMVAYLDFFNLNPTPCTKSSFVAKFTEKDLYEKSLGGERCYADVYADNKKKIEKIAIELLTTYSALLTEEELDYLDAVMSSDFIRQELVPTIFTMPENERHFYPSNQGSIGESIFQLYQLSWPQVRN